MGLRINTNIAPINAQRNVARVTQLLGGNYNRLSTGLRISSTAFQIGMNSVVGVDRLQISLLPALASTLALSSLDVGSAGDTSQAIANIDSAINTVSALRGRYGALQNRLQSTITNIGVARESLQAAESRIRDVDVAFETARLTRNTVLQQAAVSILAQANQQPQVALTLLQ